MQHFHSLFVAAVLCLVAPAASRAQSLRVGPVAGWNHDMPSGQESGDGFSFGALGGIFFSGGKDGWFADAAVLFEKKQWDSNGYLYYPYPGQGGQELSSTWHYTTYGLRVPVNAGYKWRVGRAVAMFAAAGPYISIGLAGKERHTTVSADGMVRTDFTSHNVYNDNIMNRVGWGVGLKAGAEMFGHYRLTLGYNHGMSDIFKLQHTDNKHRTLSVGVGYMF